MVPVLWFVICSKCSKAVGFVFETSCFHQDPWWVLGLGLNIFLESCLANLSKTNSSLMRVEPDAVEQDYRREERRKHKAMESEMPGAKFNTNTLSRAFDDNRSVGSAKSQKP